MEGWGGDGQTHIKLQLELWIMIYVCLQKLHDYIRETVRVIKRGTPEAALATAHQQLIQSQSLHLFLRSEMAKEKRSKLAKKR